MVLSGYGWPSVRRSRERGVQTCRAGLRDRPLMWEGRHLPHALRGFGGYSVVPRPHRGIASASPLNPLPPPIADPDQIACLEVRRRDRLGGLLHEYEHAA